MIKMKFDDLLVGFVVSIVIFFSTISTTMLNKGFLHVGAGSLFKWLSSLIASFFNKSLDSLSLSNLVCHVIDGSCYGFILRQIS